MLRKIYKKIISHKERIPIITVKEENKLLEGKVALIIGGSGGIGFSIAKNF